MIYYPNLEREISGCGIKKKDIADGLEINIKTLNNKLAGKTEFTWSETCKIVELFFPYMDKDVLFARAEQDTA